MGCYVVLWDNEKGYMEESGALVVCYSSDSDSNKLLKKMVADAGEKLGRKVYARAYGEQEFDEKFGRYIETHHKGYTIICERDSVIYKVYDNDGNICWETHSLGDAVSKIDRWIVSGLINMEDVESYIRERFEYEFSRDDVSHNERYVNAGKLLKQIQDMASRAFMEFVGMDTERKMCDEEQADIKE